MSSHLLRFLKIKNSILHFLSDGNYKPHEDHLCFFRCLAFHQSGLKKLERNQIDNISREAKRLYTSYYPTIPVTNFSGVFLDELDKLEQHFSVSIDVFEFDGQQPPKLVPRRRSVYIHGDKKNPMRLLLINGCHLSYIKNIDSLCNSFACSGCHRVFKKCYILCNHMDHCTEGKVKHYFKGRPYSYKQLTLDWLLSHGVPVPINFHYKHRVVYDIETYKCAESITDSTNPDEVATTIVNGTKYFHKLKLLSIGVCSNVKTEEEYNGDDICPPEVWVSEGDTQAIVDQWVDYLEAESDKVYRILSTTDFKDAFKHIEKLKRERDPNAVVEPEELEKKLKLYLRQLPIVGFNSGNFDLNVLKPFLIKRLLNPTSVEQMGVDDAVSGVGEEVEEDMDIDEENNIASGEGEGDNGLIELELEDDDIDETADAVNELLAAQSNRGSSNKQNSIFAIKRNNKFISLATDKLVFLDIMNFLAPGFNYKKYLAAYNASEEKGFFPYDYVTSLDRLMDPLPDRNGFFNSLKNEEMSISDYQFIQRIWEENEMVTLRDLLIWYQKLDVKPFQEALKTQCDFYHQKLGLDMLKSAVTIPGLTLRYLFKQLPHHVYFSLVSEKDKDFFQSLHSQIVGGPSIVFKRHIEKDKTKIRGGEKVVKKVVGYDCNALYLKALAQPMPTEGYGRYRKDENGKFHFQPPAYKEHACRQWLEWVAHEKGIDIQHRYHLGGQMMLGPKGNRLFLDGFDPLTRTAYEFQGCYYHGHACYLTKSNEGLNHTLGKTFEELAKETVERHQFMKDKLGIKAVVEMKECEWYKLRKSDVISEFLKRTVPSPPKLFKHPGPYSDKEIRDAIFRGPEEESLFGFIRCDIEVPDDPTLRAKFSELTPIFKNVNISLEHVGPYMAEIAKEQNRLKQPERSLIGSYFGKDIWLTTPLLKWYIEHDLEVTAIHEVVQYRPQKCFEPFKDVVTSNRLKGMLENKEILASTFKLLGNSAYGKTLENKSKHTKVLYTDTKEYESCVCNPLFKKSTPLDEEQSLFEVEMSPDKIVWDLPMQIGFFVYQYAKLRMLEFYYDFILKFIDKEDFELSEMDTDSLYMGISGDSLEALVKDDKRLEFYKEFSNYLQAESCKAHRQEFINTRVDKKEWQPTQCCKDAHIASRFEPGLFKIEHTGDVITALCSKTYITYTKHPDGREDDIKLSCKGLNKNTNNLTGTTFIDVLETGEAAGGVNRGFRVKSDGVYQYETHKKAISSVYIKRKVLADGVSTEPLDI